MGQAFITRRGATRLDIREIKEVTISDGKLMVSSEYFFDWSTSGEQVVLLTMRNTETGTLHTLRAERTGESGSRSGSRIDSTTVSCTSGNNNYYFPLAENISSSEWSKWVFVKGIIYQYYTKE